MPNPQAVIVGTASVGGQYVRGSASITRTANTTEYTVNQIVGNANANSALMTLQVGGGNFFTHNGQSATAIQSHIDIYDPAGTPTITTNNGGTIRAHLYNTAPTGNTLTDAQTWKSLQANQDVYLGYVDFSTWNISGSGSNMIRSYGTLMATPGKLMAASGAATLYAVLEHTSAPSAVNAISAAVYKLYVGAELDA